MKLSKINKKRFFPLLGLVIIFFFVFLYTNQDQKINQQTVSAASWYDYDWAKRTSITIDNTKVSADLADFPVLINSTNADWKSVSNGGYAGQDDGGDFVFTASDNITKLPHEIEKFDPVTGELVAWVKADLENLTDTVLNLYYGNALVDNQWDVAGVWDSSNTFVYHLKESNGTLVDTMGSYSLTTNNLSSVAGKIGNAVGYTKASTQRAALSWANNSSIPAGIKNAASDSLTFSAWIKPTNTGAVEHMVFSDSSWATYFYITKNANNSLTGSIRGNWEICGVRQNVARSITTAGTTYGDDQWHHAVLVVDRTIGNGAVKFYVDGALVGTSTSFDTAWEGFQWTDTNNTPGVSIGGYNDGSIIYYTGATDEFRYSKNTARSTEWIATEYNNQNDTSTFYDLGFTEDGDTTPPTNPTAIAGYDSSLKANQLTDNAWDGYDTPYFEFSGAADAESGVAGYYIYFGTDTDADPVAEGDFQAGTTYSSSALTIGETYYFRVVTKNNAVANNTSTAETLFTYKYDPTSPSSPEYINVSPVGCSTSTSFTFTWPAATDTGGSNLAGYQYRRGSTGSIESVDALTLSTTSYQEGDNILYVRSIDNAGNVSSWQTSVYCSTATVQVVDGPTVSAGPSSITVDWVSNKATTGYVKVYEGNTYISEQGLTNFSLAHSVKVIGLEPEKSYRYQITWTDQSGNLGETDWYQTSTATAPQINNLKVEVLSPTTLNVSWSSTISAKFSLEYGIGNYGTIIASGDYLTGYSRKISDLVAGSTYQFRVNATGEDGTKFFAGESVVMPPLPSIGNLRFEPIKDRPDTAVKVSWATNVELTSSVYFGLKGDSKKEISKSDKVKNHEIVVGELSDNSEYEIFAAGIDQYGNVARSNIQTLRTEYDSRPPKIDNISTESSNVASGKTDTAQITVGYTTDEPAKCFVDYGTGISGSNYTGKTVEDDILQTNHISVISDLVPQAPYHFKIICSDKAGNRSESSDQTVISGEITPSVFNIILKTLNNLFGWLGRIVN